MTAWWSIAPAPSEPPEYPDDAWLETKSINRRVKR